jgi:phosphoglucosamine mutase
MIFREFSTTGDGIVSALQILEIMVTTGRTLGELKKCLRKYPQAQRNLKVKDKPPIETLRNVPDLVREAEAALNGKGRVLLRYSGTEPKIRLLIEGRDEALINQHADRISECLVAQIGA